MKNLKKIFAEKNLENKKNFAKKSCSGAEKLKKKFSANFKNLKKIAEKILKIKNFAAKILFLFLPILFFGCENSEKIAEKNLKIEKNFEKKIPEFPPNFSFSGKNFIEIPGIPPNFSFSEKINFEILDFTESVKKISKKKVYFAVNWSAEKKFADQKNFENFREKIIADLQNGVQKNGGELQIEKDEKVFWRILNDEKTIKIWDVFANFSAENLTAKIHISHTKFKN